MSENTQTKCDNCGYEWPYGGKFSHNTTCPDCQQKTSIGTNSDETTETTTESRA